MGQMLLVEFAQKLKFGKEPSHLVRGKNSCIAPGEESLPPFDVHKGNAKGRRRIGHGSKTCDQRLTQTEEQVAIHMLFKGQNEILRIGPVGLFEVNVDPAHGNAVSAKLQGVVTRKLYNQEAVPFTVLPPESRDISNARDKSDAIVSV